MRIGLVLLSLVLAELGFRAVLRVRGTSYDSGAHTEMIREHLAAFNRTALTEQNPTRRRMAARRPELAGRVPHPFIGWQTRRARVALEGYLAEERELSEEAFVVWIVGGSVAGIFANQRSGTDRLVELLTADPRLAGREIVTRSFGMASFKQPQQLMLVGYLFSLGLRANAVVNIDGFNEVASGNANVEHGAHPVFPAIEQWGAVALTPDPDSVLAETLRELLAFLEKARWVGHVVLDRGLQRSAIVGWSAERLLGGYVRKSVPLRRRYHEAILELGGSEVLRGPVAPEERRTAMERMVDNWIASSVSLAGLCAAHGSLYVHVLQPTLHDTGSKPATDEELATGRIVGAWRRGVEQGYPALRARVDELRAPNLHFVDASGIFREVTETLYTDGCHFSGKGNQLLADAVAARLLDAIALASSDR